MSVNVDGPQGDQDIHSNGQDSAAPATRSQGELEFANLSLDPKLIIRTGASQIISLFIPVSICMFIVAFLSKNVRSFSKTGVPSLYAPFNTPNADIGTQTWQTLANVAIILTLVVISTFILVLLFKFECYKCLTGWLIFSTFAILFLVSSVFFAELLEASMIFFDNVSFAILLWNFGVVGIISIHWRSPLVLQQAYLIFNSFVIALLLLRFLPKWTCWVLLGALSIWDLIAVLCPRGPLRMLVEMAQERNRPLIPAMIYSTAAAYMVKAVDPSSTYSNSNAMEVETYLQTKERISNSQTHLGCSSPIHDAGDEGNCTTQPNGTVNEICLNKISPSHGLMHRSNTHQEPPLTTEADGPQLDEMMTPGSQSAAPNEWLRDLQEDVTEREERGVKLGLGDFVFYSVLIGRASLDGDVLTAMACYVAILVGMCLTIVALAVARRALPALPISIICGIIFYFSTAAVISPFIHATSDRRLFF